MRALFFTLVCIISSAVIAFFANKNIQNWSSQPHQIGNEVVIELSPKTKLDKLSKNLKEENVVSSEFLFKLWVKFIASIQKDGGNISKPLDILWNSVKEEFDLLSETSSRKRKMYQS